MNILSKSLFAKDAIEKLVVRCSNLKEDKIGVCGWEGLLSDLDAHHDVCEYQLVDCPLQSIDKCVSCVGKVCRRNI